MENTSATRKLPLLMGLVQAYGKCVLVAVSVTLLFGAAFSHQFYQTDAATGALQMLLAAGGGWVMMGIWAIVNLGPRKWEYIHAMGDVKQTGILAILPATVIGLLLPSVSIWIMAVSVAFSASQMVIKHIRLLRAAGLPSYLNYVWAGFLLFSASFWTSLYMIFFA